ncbi:hypothetical protein BT63DRAFT_419302 [Microthyrium microscopicum]|uniref:Uncharacterized protein n=1 Tax=Microthyrium microscopicum TaxID=703497 RepID=A0A6A6TSQ5_9PEZI|nr:hypothetical protein BT63DRAFT_419302 [Microthyrium microscopicum]
MGPYGPLPTLPALNIEANPPQLDAQEDGYSDVLLGLSNIQPTDLSNITLPRLKYAVMLPSFVGHFPQLKKFLISYKCLVLDKDDVDLNIILSDSKEVGLFEKELVSLHERCPSQFGPTRLTESEQVDRSFLPKINLVNLYDLLPPQLQKQVTPDDTSNLLEIGGKFKYQGLKKLASAEKLDHDYCLWLDSEAMVVQPFHMREVFDNFVKAPVMFTSRIGITELQHGILRDALAILGRSQDSFGARYFNLESEQWIIEKEVVQDMFDWVAKAHESNFYDVYWNTPGEWVFEICIYYAHIAARKLETVNSIFTKYRVLETERELVRFGLAPVMKHVEHIGGTGFLESIGRMMVAPEYQPQLSNFMQYYNQRFQRIYDLEIGTREAMHKFIKETPLYMLICGTPDVITWWKDFFVFNEDGSYTIDETKPKDPEKYIA